MAFTTATVLAGVGAATSAASAIKGMTGKKSKQPSVPQPSPGQTRLARQLEDIGGEQLRFGEKLGEESLTLGRDLSGKARELGQRATQFGQSQLDKYNELFSPLEDRFTKIVSGYDYMTKEEASVFDADARNRSVENLNNWYTKTRREVDVRAGEKVDVTPQYKPTSYKGVQLGADIDPEKFKAAYEQSDRAHSAKFKRNLASLVGTKHQSGYDAEMQRLMDASRRSPTDPVYKTREELDPTGLAAERAGLEEQRAGQEREIDAKIAEQTRLRDLQRTAKEREIAEVQGLSEEAAKRYIASGEESATRYMGLAEEQSQRAATEIATSADIARQSQERELTRMGIDPSSARYAALQTSAGLERAAQQAGTMNVIRSTAAPAAEQLRQQGKSAAEQWRDYSTKFKLGYDDRQLARLQSAMQEGKAKQEAYFTGVDRGFAGLEQASLGATRGAATALTARGQALPWYAASSDIYGSLANQRQSQYQSQLEAAKYRDESRRSGLSSLGEFGGTLFGYGVSGLNNKSGRGSPKPWLNPDTGRYTY